VCTRRGLVIPVFILSTLTSLVALTPACSQAAFQLPAWLVSYPGTNPAVYSSDSFAQSSYVTDARPDEVVEHYRKLFEAQGLPFQPNWDGMGNSIRAEAKECNLLIQIQKRPGGTFTKVSCAAKGDATPTAGDAPTNIEIITGITPPPPPPDPKAKAAAPAPAQTTQDVYPINKFPSTMPAPPLAWPSWLTRDSGAPMPHQTQSKATSGGSMVGRYTTSVGLTNLSDFYHQLLVAHNYTTKATPTGHRTSLGNDPGALHGFQYPNAAPGAYTEIEVLLDQAQTKDGAESSVEVRFSTHDFKASPSKQNYKNQVK